MVLLPSIHDLLIYDGVMYSWVLLHHHCFCDVIFFPVAWTPPVGDGERERAVSACVM